jgi:hypothetical protein
MMGEEEWALLPLSEKKTEEILLNQKRIKKTNRHLAL